MKKYWPSLLAIAPFIAQMFANPAQSYFASHPLVAAGVGTAIGVVNHFLTPPSQK
jgi:hypothetical protein